MRGRRTTEQGSAIVEFLLLALVVLIPLAYVVMTAVTVQRAALAETAAARDAARAYATAGSDGLGEARAEAAVALTMHDQGVAWSPTGRVVSCGDCDYAPGSTFAVTLRTTVPLPLVPSWLCGHVCVASIPVSATHRERISCLSGTGQPAASC